MKVVPLRRALEAWMREQEEQAGCVISAVGSLSMAQLRLAGASEATAIHGELEILSLSGTLSPDDAHLHIAVADGRGAVIGGHLCVGSLVRTTAELRISPRAQGWGAANAALPAMTPPVQTLRSNFMIDSAAKGRCSSFSDSRERPKRRQQIWQSLLAGLIRWEKRS